MIVLRFTAIYVQLLAVWPAQCGDPRRGEPTFSLPRPHAPVGGAAYKCGTARPASLVCGALLPTRKCSRDPFSLSCAHCGPAPQLLHLPGASGHEFARAPPAAALVNRTRGGEQGGVDGEGGGGRLWRSRRRRARRPQLPHVPPLPACSPPHPALPVVPYGCRRHPPPARRPHPPHPR